MLIDWFTVGAQIVNFLVLIWLLKHFLYKPVLDAIDAREQRIARREQAASDAQAAAEQVQAQLAQQQADFEQQHKALLQQAAAEAQTARQQLLDSARAEASNLRSQWQEALRKEQQSLRQSITTRTSHEVFAIARKMLAELADTELESRIVSVFIQRLHNLEAAETAQLQATEVSADFPVLIRSAFPLPANQQTALTQAVQDALHMTPDIHFATDPELLSGIELISNGHKVAWSIADYLEAMEAGLAKLLGNKITSGEFTHAT
ncbi:MAG: F0F1 ATP synthase subunit B [Candidatus Thiothrix singaporensis]|uniref:ATP synthase subunit b n=1 Tax=Candidatus Thiothrix singaporensis TaxID=2799669 RepID=A0A7L6AUJ4_9GAMM|nr:MAG: F0F1 ATP synthase subunit B [Candidatus Thiothrix singaporensis]